MARVIAAVAGLLLVLNAFGAQAQAWPDKPIHLVIPFSPGGFTDVPGRILGQRLSEALGQPVVVENKTGAGSTIGTDFVAKAKPDGYTLLFTAVTHVISPQLYKNAAFDPIADFVPIIKVASGPYVVVVHPSLEAKSIPELIALARAQPGKIDFASSGNGSTQHLVGAYFAAQAAIDINHVPYRGSAQATQDLIGGHVKLGFVGTPIAIPNVKSGRMRALAVSTLKRSPEMPDVPTLDESGLKGFDATTWLGLLAPAGTPPAVVGRIHDEMVKLLALPEVQQSLVSTGLELDVEGPQAFGALLKTERQKWGKIIKDSGARVN